MVLTHSLLEIYIREKGGVVFPTVVNNAPPRLQFVAFVAAAQALVKEAKSRGIDPVTLFQVPELTA